MEKLERGSIYIYQERSTHRIYIGKVISDPVDDSTSVFMKVLDSSHSVKDPWNPKGFDENMLMSYIHNFFNFTNFSNFNGPKFVNMKCAFTYLHIDISKIRILGECRMYANRIYPISSNTRILDLSYVKDPNTT